MACLRLRTVLPLRPLLSVPDLRRRIADFTALPAPLLYLAIVKPPRWRSPSRVLHTSGRFARITVRDGDRDEARRARLACDRTVAVAARLREDAAGADAGR